LSIIKNNNKSYINNFILSFYITIILITSDFLYSLYNEYYLFNFTPQEILKLMIIFLFITLIHNYKIRLSLLILIIFLSFFQYVHFSYFGKNISAIEFYLFATNIDETFEALNSMLKITLVPTTLTLISLIGIYILNKKMNNNIYYYKYTIHLFVCILLLLSYKIYYLTNIKTTKLTDGQAKYIYPMINRHSSRNFIISLSYYTIGILPKQLFLNNTKYPKQKTPTLIKNDSNQTIILLIGESLRSDKFSLEQHNLLTPKLQTLKNDNNFYYKNVYAGGTMTKVSVSVLINRIKYPNMLEQISNESNCLFKLAKNTNKHTYFITAQHTKHIQMIKDMICPKYIDNLYTRNNFNQLINKPVGYDNDLLTIIKKLNIINKNNFIVLQQRGSHTPYTKQSPKSFKKYKSSYDNSVLYTDTTIYNLISYIKKIPNTTLIYVSDHGELLGEGGHKGHGYLDKIVYTVPLIIYTTNKNKEDLNIIKNINSHYDISNYITHLLGYTYDLKNDNNKTIYILNSDLNGFSGYKRITIN